MKPSMFRSCYTALWKRTRPPTPHVTSNTPAPATVRPSRPPCGTCTARLRDATEEEGRQHNESENKRLEHAPLAVGDLHVGDAHHQSTAPSPESFRGSRVSLMSQQQLCRLKRQQILSDAIGELRADEKGVEAKGPLARWNTSPGTAPPASSLA